MQSKLVHTCIIMGRLSGIDDTGNVTLAQGLHDTTRTNFYKSYLMKLKNAIDGANVVGYFAWSLLDNSEWRLRYTSRFKSLCRLQQLCWKSRRFGNNY
ncbi:hypothetical protein TIFTF001_015474 [Ficus carica]|uniref:Beta-glucosidase n=1 Tax=Ficus carica TaxID=3494 RepID=A0AA88D557_FICCA|nr:hypothetical protein TIFTF001_015474 [Ficus carica]